MEKSAQAGLVGYARLEGVAQIFRGRDGVVFVVVVTHDVDVGRECRLGSGLGVLLVNPTDFEVGALREVGRAFHSDLVDGVAGGQGAVESVPLDVSECRLQGPAASGVDVSNEFEVHIVVDGPVITSVFQVEASVGRFAERRDDNTRALAFAVRYQGKRYHHG